MIPATLSGTEIKFHRSDETKYFCLIDLKEFEVSTVSNDEGLLRIELTQRSDHKRGFLQFLEELEEFSQQRKR
ncbi:MAG TPA: hypothetical protein VIX17_12790 [Pyrinomonadaceae bacterium]|jgi:hypothetical protein